MATPPPRAVLLKGPTLNSKVFMTALPERHEDLLAKACELFKVPSDHTPHLYVSCQASVGTPHSEQRGALLLSDAMPFLRDREMITLRWVPTTDPPRREKDVRNVRWDTKLDEPAPLSHMRPTAVPAWRGPQARAMHVARVLERERIQSAQDELVPRKPTQPLYTAKPSVTPDPPFHTAPMSPPPSSPTTIPAARDENPSPPSSPTPNPMSSPARTLDWGASGDSDDDHPSSATSSPSKSDRHHESRKSSFGAWCARLNPFARSEDHKDEEPEDKSDGPSPSAPADKALPDLHVTGSAAYDVMTQVLMAVREHARNVHCKVPHEFCARQAGLSMSLGTCVAKRAMSEDKPLRHFADALDEYLDTCVTTKGPMIEPEVSALRAFAYKLMDELQRTSAPVAPPPSKEVPPPEASPEEAPASTRTTRRRGAPRKRQAAAPPPVPDEPLAKRTRRSTRHTKA